MNTFFLKNKAGLIYYFFVCELPVICAAVFLWKEQFGNEKCVASFSLIEEFLSINVLSHT